MSPESQEILKNAIIVLCIALAAVFVFKEDIVKWVVNHYVVAIIALSGTVVGGGFVFMG